MKCLVCGKEYDAAECPRCHFPNIQIMGDRETALAQLMPTILAFRKTFLEKVEVSLLIYRWKEGDGRIVPDCEEYLPLGTAAALQAQETWVCGEFARIPDLETISVTVSVTAPDGIHRLQISVPNLPEPQLQQIGARLDEELQLQLLLRNASREGVSSAPVPLLGA